MDNIKAGYLISLMLVCGDIDSLRKELMKSDEASWSLLAAFAAAYNLLPLVYFKLHEIKMTSLLPFNMLEQLQLEFNAASRFSLKRHYEMKAILDILHGSGIEAMPIKGSFNAAALYKNPAVRPMCDIDLLVKKDDLAKAMDILLNSGFSYAQGHDKEFKGKDFIGHLDGLRGFTKHMPEMKTPRGFSLEIHWALDYKGCNTRIDMDEVWGSKEKISLYETTCYRMKTELYLLYLCVDIAEDCFKQKILQLYDVYQLASIPDINWNYLLERGSAWNCIKPLYGVLSAEVRLFGLDIPAEHLRKLKLEANCPEEIESAIINSTFSGLNITGRYEDKIGHEFMPGSVIEKLKLLYWTLWSKEKIFYHYGTDNGALKIFYYRMKRTVYVVKKYLGSFLRLYLKDSSKTGKLADRCNSFKLVDEWLNGS